MRLDCASNVPHTEPPATPAAFGKRARELLRAADDGRVFERSGSGRAHLPLFVAVRKELSSGGDARRFRSRDAALSLDGAPGAASLLRGMSSARRYALSGTSRR